MPAASVTRGRRRGEARSEGREPLAPGAWTRLAACTAAAALLQLDGTLIAVALPAVAHGLRVSGASTSVLLSAYFCAYALVLIPGGWLVDRFGSRRLALIGLSVFALGAAAGALAAGMGWLIAARVVQGAGAGLVSPAALAGAVSGFPPQRRGGALGIWGASAGLSNLLGPLLGGLLTVTLGWRADWWALVPLALAAAAGIAWQLPALAGSGASAAIATESKTVLNRVVVAATLVAALTFAVMIGAFYLAEQYLQDAAGYSALAASGALVLVALLVGCAAPLAGRLVDRRGEQLPALVGFLALGVGLLVLGLPGVSLRNPATLAPLVPVGLGLGVLFVPTSRAALNATPIAAHGRTSAVLSAGRLAGAAIGAAAAGAALSGGVSASAVHHSLLLAGGLCLFLGLPAARSLRPRPAPPAAQNAVGDALGEVAG
jgi:MFS transporter, DHA2 family, methylenomycin A resistance protein